MNSRMGVLLVGCCWVDCVGVAGGTASPAAASLIEACSAVAGPGAGAPGSGAAAAEATATDVAPFADAPAGGDTAGTCAVDAEGPAARPSWPASHSWSTPNTDAISRTTSARGIVLPLTYWLTWLFPSLMPC